MQSTIQPQQEMKTKDMTTLHLRKSIGFLIPLAFVCFALSPAPKAFGVRPPPDGGYSGNNTAEGTHALFSLTTGVANTAVGFSALFHNTIGGDNTATGSTALYNNITGIDNTANGWQSLYSNTTGNSNTATGFVALQGNTTCSNNTVRQGRNPYQDVDNGRRHPGSVVRVPLTR